MGGSLVLILPARRLGHVLDEVIEEFV